MGEAIPLPQRKGTRTRFELVFEGIFKDLNSGPDVTFQFDGAEIILMKQTTYIEQVEGLWCLSILRFGQLLSEHSAAKLFVGYDVDEEVISFSPS